MANNLELIQQYFPEALASAEGAPLRSEDPSILKKFKSLNIDPEMIANVQKARAQERTDFTPTQAAVNQSAVNQSTEGVIQPGLVPTQPLNQNALTAGLYGGIMQPELTGPRAQQPAQQQKPTQQTRDITSQIIMSQMSPEKTQARATARKALDFAGLSGNYLETQQSSLNELKKKIADYQGQRYTPQNALERLNLKPLLAMFNPQLASAYTPPQSEAEQKYEDVQLAQLVNSKEQELGRTKIAMLKAIGADNAGSNGKILPAGKVEGLSKAATIPELVREMTSIFENNKDIMGRYSGKIAKIASWIPGISEEYRTRIETVDGAIAKGRQIIGKVLEGGVLRKEDETKYKKILADLDTDPQAAINKLYSLSETVSGDIKRGVEWLGVAGYDVSRLKPIIADAFSKSPNRAVASLGDQNVNKMRMYLQQGANPKVKETIRRFFKENKIQTSDTAYARRR